MNWVKTSLALWLFFFWVGMLAAQSNNIQDLQQELQLPNLPKDSLVHIYHQLTQAYVAKHDYAAAIRATKGEINLLKSLDKPLQLGKAYFNLASIRRAISHFNIAIQQAKKALTQFEKATGKQSYDYASTLRFLAQTYSLSSIYKTAKQYAFRAITTFSKLDKRYPKEEIDLQLLLGSLYHKQADDAQAYKLFLKAKAIYEVHEGELSVQLLTRIYNNLAVIRAKDNAPLEALSYYQKIAAIRQSIHTNNHLSLASTYYNIGFCYYKIEDYATAIRYQKKSNAIFVQAYGQEHSKVARGLTHLGAYYKKRNHLDSAIHNLQAAIETYTTIFGPSPSDIIRPLEVLAKVYRLQEKYTLAQQTLLRAIGIQQKHFGTTHPRLANMYLDIGYIQQELEQYPLASRTFEKAQKANSQQAKPLDLEVQLQVHTAILNNSLQLAAPYQTKAFERLGQLAPLANQIVSKINYQADKKRFLQLLRKACEAGIALCHTLYQQQRSITYIKQALQLMEYNKAVILQLENKTRQSLQALPLALQQQYQELEAHLQQLEMQWQAAQYLEQPTQKTKVQQQLFDAQQSLEQFKKSHLKEWPPLAYQPITLQQLQQAIYHQQQLLNYFYGNEALYVLVLETEKTSFYKITDSIQNQIDTFLPQVLDLSAAKKQLRKSCMDYDSSAYQLYQALFPFAPSQQLIILADGPLNYIPFEALTPKRNLAANGFHALDYLIHQHAVSYAYSATTYAQQQQHRNRPQATILGIAPDFLATDLPPLTANQEEVQQLAHTFAGSYFYGNEATKHQFSEAASKHSILHLATHALANDQKWQQPQLFFATVSKDSMNNILYPHEIRQLSLHTDLVTLSACQTGIGYWQKGEGIMSLARDFLAAGVPAVLTTLWQVNDQSSSQLMHDFYGQVESSNKVLALQYAKKQYLNKASAFGAHPYFWSGYILVGNTQPLSIAKPSYFLWYIMGGLLFFVIISSFFIIRKQA